MGASAAHFRLPFHPHIHFLRASYLQSVGIGHVVCIWSPYYKTHAQKCAFVTKCYIDDIQFCMTRRTGKVTYSTDTQHDTCT